MNNTCPENILKNHNRVTAKELDPSKNGKCHRFHNIDIIIKYLFKKIKYVTNQIPRALSHITHKVKKWYLFSSIGLF